MTGPGDPTAAFWRTRGVSRAIGLDLGRALETGRVSEGGYAELVASCCCCAHAETCLDWLGRHGAGSAGPPEFCRNRLAFEALSRRP